MLELVFVTSNNEKLAHARYLCRDSNVKISKQKNYGIGYVEPRISNRDELISQSVESAKERFYKSNSEDSLFFIEDTSVCLEGLSTTDKEFPGTDVKYWMRETTFSKLDNQLKEIGNNRNVIIRSDVILVLNKELKNVHKKDYIIFTSSSKGSVVVSESGKIKTQALYPWLNNRTFNKWFVPFGEKKPLSTLSITIANKYDFRRGAFEEMLAFLKTNHLIKEPSSVESNSQTSLFSPASYIICGPTCAGKSTLSSYLLDSYNYYYLEASDFMHLSYYETHGLNSEVTIGDFAQKALKNNPSIVVDQITKHLDFLKKDIPFIITGFRSPKEIEAFENWLGSTEKVKKIYIDCNLNERFRRDQLRNRNDKSKDLKKFDAKNKQQEEMGLGQIKSSIDFSTNKILNEKTIPEFYSDFETLYEVDLEYAKYFKINKHTAPKYIKNKKLQNTIISALNDTNPEYYYTTTEIAHLIENNIHLEKKNKNNISRYFRQKSHPYFEIKINESGIPTYRLSQTGRSYYQWLKF